MTQLSNEQLQLLAAAALQVLKNINQLTYAGTAEALVSAVRGARPGSFTVEDVREALRALEHMNVMTRSAIGTTSDYIRIESHLLTSRFKRGDGYKLNASKIYPLLYEYERFGSAWLDTVWGDYFPTEAPTGSDITADQISTYAPAADRVVRLTDNQVVEAENGISKLVSVLEFDNGVESHPGLRERLLGQFKAARELVRAGEYFAHLLYDTLLRGLGELIEKYGKTAIVAVANAFLGAAVSLLMQVN